MNCALKAIENVRLARYSDLKRLIIFIAAGFTACHCEFPPFATRFLDHVFHLLGLTHLWWSLVQRQLGRLYILLARLNESRFATLRPFTVAGGESARNSRE